MNKQSVSCAILLAAGRGKRLSPYTDNIPKPLLAYNGKPTLTYLLDSLREARVRRVALVTHHLSDQIIDYARTYQKNHDIDILCTPQSQLGGTADALESAANQLPEDWLSGSLLLSATDYLVSKCFFPNFLDFHASHAQAVSISLKQVGDEQTMRSSVQIDACGYIKEVVEKPPPGSAPSEYTANLTYVLPSEILTLLEGVEASPRGEREVQSAINRFLRTQGPARGLLQPTPAEWQPNFSVA